MAESDNPPDSATGQRVLLRAASRVRCAGPHTPRPALDPLSTAEYPLEIQERQHESLANSHPDAEQLAWYWNALATALQYIGERAEAETYFAKAVAVAQGGGWRRIEAMALHHWGRSLVEQGQLYEADLRIAQALAIREGLGEPRQETSRKALAEIAKLRAASDA
jgi:tetratricopeptide (TPR) repeat protein